MFIYLRRKKGQSTLEYGVIIAVVVAGLIAMQTYIKRGLQGRLRQASDDIGEQFSPGYTTGNYIVNTAVNSTENVLGGNQPITTSHTDQTQNRDVTENVAVFTNEHWPGAGAE